MKSHQNFYLEEYKFKLDNHHKKGLKRENNLGKISEIRAFEARYFFLIGDPMFSIWDQ